MLILPWAEVRDSAASSQLSQVKDSKQSLGEVILFHLLRQRIQSAWVAIAVGFDTGAWEIKSLGSQAKSEEGSG